MTIAPRAGQVLADLCIAINQSGYLRARLGNACRREFFPAGERRKAIEVEQRKAVNDDMTDFHNSFQADQCFVIDLILRSLVAPCHSRSRAGTSLISTSPVLYS